MKLLYIVGIYLDEYCFVGPSGRFTHIYVILNRLGQVLFLGRAPRTKEALPNFREWSQFTRHPLLFCGLTGSQRTPGIWGVTFSQPKISPKNLDNRFD